MRISETSKSETSPILASTCLSGTCAAQLPNADCWALPLAIIMKAHMPPFRPAPEHSGPNAPPA